MPPHEVQAGNWGYRFVCGACNGGQERFGYIIKSWEAITHIALYNLKLRGIDPAHVRDHIARYIDQVRIVLCVQLIMNMIIERI